MVQNVNPRLYQDLNVLRTMGRNLPNNPMAQTTRKVYPTATARADLQAANDELREAGGGMIELFGGAVYTLDTIGLVIDVGAGVGIRGNGAYLDCRNVAGGTSALTLTSRQKNSGVVFPGVDTDSRNFFGKRAYVEGFMLMGASGVSAADGIDVDMTPIDGGRAPRAVVRNVVTQGFYRGIRHRNKAYLCSFENGGVSDAEIGLSYEGGADQGENTVFRNFSFGNCNDVGILIDCPVTVDPDSNVNLRFEGCSIDYNLQFIRHVAGLGQCRFINCYYEWASAGTTVPFDFSATASNRMLWVFDNPDFVDNGGTKLYTTLFKIGNLHDVRLNNPWLHNIGGAGIQMTTTGSPTAGPTYMTALAEVTGTGRFKVRGISDYTTTALPRTPTNIAFNNMLSDGTFEQTAISDAWYAAGGVGTLSLTTTDKHTGTKCLQAPITTAVSTAKSIRCAIPRANGARFVSVQGFAKLSAGTGSISSVTLVPALITGAVTVGTAPTIVRSGAALSADANRVLSAAGWTNFGTSGSLPRPEVPEWCNYLILIIDLFAVDNNGGNVWVDDLQVEQW